MINKIILLILTLTSLTACGNANQAADTKDKQNVDISQSVESENKEHVDKDDSKEKPVEENDKKTADNKKTITVTTTFIADMVNELIGDTANVELIIPAGSDPHMYVAKPEDLNKLTQSDLVLYHGIHFEGKMVDALEEVGYALASTFDKEKIGQMEDEEDESQMVEDPHFWFDIDLYKEAFSNAANKLKELYKDDDQVVETINKNEKNYLEKLDDLDNYNKEKLAEIPEESRYLITPHDAFNYFSRRYGIEVKAPQGVSTDSEVSNKDLEDTAQFIADHKIKAIFAESTTNPERMEKLKDIVKSKGFETKVIHGDGQELYSDSLDEKGKAGDNFIDMYKHNIDLIVENLK